MAKTQGVPAMLKVWGRTNSVNVQKVLWCCVELGLAFERIDAGGQFGVVDTAEYRRLNPNGLVPLIEDGSFVLWESNAIVRYLAAAYGAGGLCPADPQARALADQWMDWQATTNGPMTVIFWGLIRTDSADRDPAAIAAAAEQAGGLWRRLEEHLAGRPYVAGDSLTMGDIPVGAMAYRWTQLDVPRPPIPNVEAWQARLSERPGFREHIMQPLS